MKKLVLFLMAFVSIVAKAQNPSDGCPGTVLSVNSSCSPSAYSLPGSYGNGGLLTASCFTGNDRDDGWYQITPTASGPVTVEATGDLGMLIAVFTSCAGGTELGCDAQLPGNTLQVTFTATAGVTYYVQVHRLAGNNSASLSGTICAYEGVATPPSGGGTACNDAETLTPGTQQCGTNDNVGSFPDDGSSPTNPCSSSYNDGEYWYSYTGTGDALQLDVSGLTDTYAGLFVLDDCPSNSPNCVASYTNGFSSSDFSVTTPALTVGQTYYIGIVNWSSPYSTDFCLDASIYIPPPPPANDDCSGAIGLTVNPDLLCGTTTSGTVDAATPSSQSQTDCSGTENDDVWYSFVATSTSHEISLLNVAGSATDMYHSVWEGTCPSLTLVSSSCSDANSQILGGLTPGNTYFVRVNTYGSSSGQNTTFDICIGTPPPPPSNDECVDAISAPVNPDNVCTNFISGWTSYATSSMSGCTGTASDDVWFSFVATAGEHSFEISNATGTTDLVHEVFEGPCGSLTSLGCSDPNTSTVTGLTIGDTYYVRVYTYSSSGNNTGFDLCITTTCDPSYTEPTCGLDYTHSTIAYNPSNYNTGSTLTFSDDRFADAYTSIGFPFCFDGIWYEECLVSSNGYIIFPGCYSSAPTETDLGPGTYSPYSMYTDAPNTDDAPRNAIMGPWQDIDPSISGSVIRTSIEGTAPNRVFVLKFDQVGMYSCTSDDFSGQIMLYETTNNIEVHIGEKTSCSWNSNGAILGLHDYSGTQAVIPAGYNYSTPWTVPTNSPEGHLFTNNCNCLVVLPVELSDFRGEKLRSSNLLKWETITENGNDYFVLEASNDGVEFYAVAQIDGAGTSLVKQEYEFEHLNPGDAEYYRLRQVDLNGTVNYTKTIALKNQLGSDIVYPNPSYGKLFMNVQSSKNQQMTIVYSDLLGKTHQEVVSVSINEMKYELQEFKTLTSGVYQVVVFDADDNVIIQESIVKM